ncbi:MAG: DUF1045 domain-containing protein [Actinomycetota bacterium]
MTARCAIYVAPGLPPWDGPVASAVRERADARIARTVSARRYGYHATLKAPFRLHHGLSIDDDLVPAVAEFAAARRAVTVPAADIRSIGSFWAIMPGAPAPELHALSDQVVSEFDRFRARPSDAEIARRHPELLTERQRELLERWGYPYVFDEFRFHITLTDELPERKLESVGADLRAEFAAYLGADLPVSALVVFVEPEPGAEFFVHSIHPLSAEEAK